MDEPLSTLPFDTQLEEHLIGCFIYDPACISEAVEIIKPAYFYHRGYRKIAERIFELWEQDEQKVDLTELAPTCEAAEVEITRVGAMVRSIATTANIEQHCERLRDVAALRAGIRIGQELAQKGYLRDRDEIRDAIATAEAKMSRVTDMTIRTDTMVSMREAVMQFHEDFEKVVNGGAANGITGLATGLEELDSITAGLQNSDLIVIGARPSMGKTTFMMQLALNISLRPDGSPGEPGAIFSLEQSRSQLIMRAIANRAGIDMEALKSGLLVDEDWHKYTLASAQLTAANLVIDDQSKLSVAEIKAKARRIKRELGGLRYILIDYLGKVRGNGANRYDEVSENIRSLKDLAKDFGVPVVVLAQLSRKVEERQDKRPMMSDLRDSGEIEQEADLIGFLYRDDYYDKESSKKNIVELIIAKHRNGRTGSVEFMFRKEFNRIIGLDRGGRADAPEQMALL